MTQIKNFLQSLGDIITEEKYGEEAAFIINLPLDKKNGFMEAMAALSNGTAKIRKL